MINETIKFISGDDSPQIGDTAYVYWHGYGWFTATIKDWLPDELCYMIKWTDGNWAAERAKYDNLCVDKVHIFIVLLFNKFELCSNLPELNLKVRITPGE